MGRGRSLSETEVAVILALAKTATKSIRDIAAEVGRSKTAVENVLKRKGGRRGTSRLGRPPKETPHFRREVVRAAFRGFETARSILEQHQSPVGLRRVQQLLHEATYLQWSKLQKAPRLTPAHKVHCKRWAAEQLALSAMKWRRTVFSDEKRFCLDGPDDSASYWADTRVDKRYFSTRQQEGGGVMVWGCFCWRGMPELVIVPGKMNAQCYIDVLDEVLLPWIEQTYAGEWRFQQENAPVHTGNVTQEYFMSQGIPVIDWPLSEIL